MHVGNVVSLRPSVRQRLLGRVYPKSLANLIPFLRVIGVL